MHTKNLKTEENNSICKIDEKIDFKKMNEILKSTPIKKSKIPNIMKKNLDRLGIKYKDENNNKTYFGIQVYEDKLIKLNEIKKLPFFEFFDESMKGSTYVLINDLEYIYLNDWENFCKYFIETGKHRYSKDSE